MRPLQQAHQEKPVFSSGLSENIHSALLEDPSLHEGELNGRFIASFLNWSLENRPKQANGRGDVCIKTHHQ